MNYTETQIKTRYVESDQMGIIHHSNYMVYLELARLEWLEKLGFSYVVMEQENVLLPVYKIDITYKKPIKFNQEIVVKTMLKKVPTTRVEFFYEIIDQKGDICATCDLTLVFTNADTFRPMKPSPDFVDACKRFLDS